MDVARYRVRPQALFNGGLGHGVVEAAAAMPDVDDHAALLGFQRGGDHLALLHRVVAGAAVGMRQDVARAQQVEQLAQVAGRIADVAHEAPPGPRALECFERAPERLEAVGADHIERLAHLHAEQHVLVLCQRLGRQVDLRVVDVQHLTDRETGQPDRRDVQEAQDAAARLGDDVMLERREVVRTGIAGTDVRGGGRVGHQFIGRQPDRRALREHMGMQVDQARCDELARRVEHLGGGRHCNVGLDSGDAGVADSDVATGMQVLARIDDVAALDDEVELVRPPDAELGPGRAAQHQRWRRTAGSENEIAPGDCVHDEPRLWTLRRG